MHDRRHAAPATTALPREPIHRVSDPIVRFLHIEAASGAVLLVATIVALFVANSPWSADYARFWQMPVGFEIGSLSMQHSLRHWINDGLMAIFFFVVGLEVKRELVVGELRNPRKAALPVAAAIGGMVVPACVYLAFQYGQPAERGWGVPMATDIAFVVGCMTLLGRRVTHGLRIMLLSLAIADDIGAILVIAVGYTEAIRVEALAVGAAMLAAVWCAARVGVRSRMAYVALGTLAWVAFHESGVHATVAGVMLGLLTPAKHYVSGGRFHQWIEPLWDIFEGDWDDMPTRVETVRQIEAAARETVPPTEYLQSQLHAWVAFGIMPLFALANAGVALRPSDFVSSVAVAVAAGLVLGKPIGIVAFAWLAVRTRVASLPSHVTWLDMLAGGCLAGIGFTMALFIAQLALDEPMLSRAKVGVLAGSAISAAIGVLLFMRPRLATASEERA